MFNQRRSCVRDVSQPREQILSRQCGTRFLCRVNPNAEPREAKLVNAEHGLKRIGHEPANVATTDAVTTRAAATTPMNQPERSWGKTPYHARPKPSPSGNPTTTILNAARSETNGASETMPGVVAPKMIRPTLSTRILIEISATAMRVPK